jgi:hypothetical protein
MRTPTKRFLAAAVLALALTRGLPASDKDVIPPQLPKDQQENLLRFLQQHDKPDRYIPDGAKIVDTPPPNAGGNPETPPARPVKQYTVSVVAHRPVPDQAEVKRADVYYYRPNPEKGKPGITVRYTVDLTNGQAVGQPEVLFNHHTPVSREELEEAVALAREKSPAVQELYKGREANAVRWEYLQLFVSRKHEAHEPGDRVVRFVFTAPAAEGQAPPAPARVVVNLTKGVVADER